MNSNNFLQVVYASSVDPVETSKALVPYRSQAPPDSATISRLRKVPPQGEYSFHHPLALKLGVGSHKHPENFQSAGNMHGVDLMSCRKWKFKDGIFQNDETIAWPGNTCRAADVLIFDPSWPWMMLVIERPSAHRTKLLESGKAELESSDETWDRLFRDAQYHDGMLIWQPGDFQIHPTALTQDIVDTRSPAQKYYAGDFERGRQSLEYHAAQKTAKNPEQYSPAERRAAEKVLDMKEGSLDPRTFGPSPITKETIEDQRKLNASITEAVELLEYGDVTIEADGSVHPDQASAEILEAEFEDVPKEKDGNSK